MKLDPGKPHFGPPGNLIFSLRSLIPGPVDFVSFYSKTTILQRKWLLGAIGVFLARLESPEALFRYYLLASVYWMLATQNGS